MATAAGGSDARVVASLDFGTTFSGFASVHTSDPSKVWTFYEWPEQASGGGRPYCKTQTSLYYIEDKEGKLKLESWGWPASVTYTKVCSTGKSKRVPRQEVELEKLNQVPTKENDLEKWKQVPTKKVDLVERKLLKPQLAGSEVPAQDVEVGNLVTHVKLHLVGSENEPLSAQALPDGLTTRTVTTEESQEVVLEKWNQVPRHEVELEKSKQVPTEEVALEKWKQVPRKAVKLVERKLLKLNLAGSENGPLSTQDLPDGVRTGTVITEQSQEVVLEKWTQVPTQEVELEKSKQVPAKGIKLERKFHKLHVAGSEVPTQDVKVGKLVTLFKLHLAGSENGPLSAQALPDGLTTRTVITDYLREISKFIMVHLKNRYGNQLSMQEVQWCLTVPAIWDDQAKQRMKSFAEEAGLVRGSSNDIAASPHPLMIVLEPEAAAVYCLQNLEGLSFREQDKFLTVDIGGGTVDIVVHEKLQSGDANPRLKEVTRSTGGLCGGTYVDKNFLQHLVERIGCLRSFFEENPLTLLSTLRWWEGIKSTFDGTQNATFDTSAKLAKAWEVYDSYQRPGAAAEHGYDEVELTQRDLMSIFDPVVEQIIKLIKDALDQVWGEVKVIMAVGGFSASPYLMSRLKTEFQDIVGGVVSPPDPGSAVCVGAAMLGVAPQDIIRSRICRKTYGQRICREFLHGDPVSQQFTNDDGYLMCDHVFSVFVENGDEVPINHSVTKLLFPSYHGSETMLIEIVSTNKKSPKYTCEEGVVEEGEFELDMSAGMHLDMEREVEVTMLFGRSSIEVTAKGVNFDASGGAENAIPVAFSGGND